MDTREWLATITDDQPGAIAKRSGIPRRTLYNQIDRGEFTMESLIKISSAYNSSPLEALIEMGHVAPEWADVPNVIAALRQATDEQLTDEILRRLKLGSKRFDTPLDELAERRSNMDEWKILTVRNDERPRRIADSSPDNPEEDDEFGD